MRPPSSPDASCASARLAAPRVVASGNDDMRAFAAECDGDLAADVAGGSRDEGRLVLESSCHDGDASY
jgi:hypothetical protein